jgi:hypothetical protein
MGFFLGKNLDGGVREVEIRRLGKRGSVTVDRSTPFILL